jgi:hypothetical protein
VELTDEGLATIRQNVQWHQAHDHNPLLANQAALLLDTLDKRRERGTPLLEAATEVVAGMYQNDDEWFGLTEKMKTRLVNLEHALKAFEGE